MIRGTICVVVVAFQLLCSSVSAQKITANVPYANDGHERHLLDIYTPDTPAGGPLPVMFWIHGGGWRLATRVMWL